MFFLSNHRSPGGSSRKGTWTGIFWVLALLRSSFHLQPFGQVLPVECGGRALFTCRVFPISPCCVPVFACLFIHLFFIHFFKSLIYWPDFSLYTFWDVEFGWVLISVCTCAINPTVKLQNISSNSEVPVSLCGEVFTCPSLWSPLTWFVCLLLLKNQLYTITFTVEYTLGWALMGVHGQISTIAVMIENSLPPQISLHASVPSVLYPHPGSCSHPSALYHQSSTWGRW